MITITVPLPDCPSPGQWRQQWYFYINGLQLRLTRFEIQTRASNRHKWRVEKKWSWIDSRDNDFKHVPLPPEAIVQQARLDAASRITVWIPDGTS